jgi:hypothetical protein
MDLHSQLNPQLCHIVPSGSRANTLAAPDLISRYAVPSLAGDTYQEIEAVQTNLIAGTDSSPSVSYLEPAAWIR